MTGMTKGHPHADMFLLLMDGIFFSLISGCPLPWYLTQFTQSREEGPTGLP